MRLNELVDVIKNNINKYKEDKWFYPQDLLDLLEIYDHIEIDFNVFKKYDIYTWICTDTQVGISAYTLNDNLVCIGYKPYRKYDETFYFTSKNDYEDLYNYLISLSKKSFEHKIQTIDDNINIDLIKMCDDIEYKSNVKKSI